MIDHDQIQCVTNPENHQLECRRILAVNVKAELLVKVIKLIRSTSTSRLLNLLLAARDSDLVIQIFEAEDEVQVHARQTKIKVNVLRKVDELNLKVRLEILCRSSHQV